MGHQVVIITDTVIAGALQDRFVQIDCGQEFRNRLKNGGSPVSGGTPGLVISIERPGMAADGRYYNMSGEDITHTAALQNPTLCSLPALP